MGVQLIVRHGQQKNAALAMLVGLIKHTEARISMDSLCLQVVQIPKS